MRYLLEIRGVFVCFAHFQSYMFGVIAVVKQLDSMLCKLIKDVEEAADLLAKL
jgi:hypothetical protein